MRIHPLRALVCLIVGLCSAAAGANSDTWHFSGFGTLGATWLDDREVFFNHPAKGRDDARRPDLGADSLIGVQTSLGLGERTDFTLQLMSAQDSRGRYTPRVTWAYLRHNVTPGVTARVGRLRAPFFMLSDALNINYAHPWVRPPVEVYGLNPFNDLDGIDLLYQHRLGDIDIELQPYFGQGKVRFPDGKAQLRRHIGLNVNLTRGNLSLQLGHGGGRISVDYGDPLFHFVRAQLLNVGRDAQAARLAGKHGRARFDSIGFRWDDGRMHIIGEYARRSASRYVTQAHGWHLTTAYRVGKFAPFVTIARQSLDRHVLARSPDVPGLGPYLDSRNQAQRSVTLGTRWDVRPNAALKAQWTRNWVNRDAWGAFFPKGDPIIASPAGRRIDMLSLSVDFTF